jgi:hypothetical protein
VQYAEVVGNLAYLAFREQGLVIADVSDPSSPEQVSSLQLGSWPEVTFVRVKGDYAYVGMVIGGVWIVDITDPEHPTIVGVYEPVEGGGNAVEVIGDYAFVAASFGTVHVVDLTDRSAPAFLVALPTGSFQVVDLVEVGGRLYVATDESVKIVDVSNPLQPSIVGLVDTSWGGQMDLHVADSTIYVADGNEGLIVLDASNPPNLTWEGSLGGDYAGASGAWARGDVAYLVDSAALHVIDVPDATLPIREHTIPADVQVTLMAQDGPLLFAAGEDGRGLAIVDISNPDQPTYLGGLPPEYQIRDMTAVGDYLYVAADGWGLKIIDISNPLAPFEVGALDTDGSARAVQVLGNYAYVADHQTGLKIVDVSNPGSPSLVGSIGSDEHSDDVVLQPGLAYVADGDGGLRIIDVTDPSNPTQVGQMLSTQGGVDRVLVDGTTAYLVQDSVVTIADVSDPTNLQELGQVYAHSEAEGVWLEGSQLYLATGQGGLQRYNVADPQAPEEAGSYVTTGTATDVLITGDRIFIAGSQQGLHVLERVEPSMDAPTLSYSRVGTQLHLSWEAAYAGYQLEYADALPGSAWTPLNNGASTSMDVPIESAGTRFYRLRSSQ